MRSLWTAASRHKKKKSSTSEETSCNTQHWMTQARPRTVNLEGEERPFEKEDWHNLVRNLNRPLVSSYAITRPECREDCKMQEGLAMGTLSLICLWETQHMYTVHTGSPQHTVTPEYTGIESGFQEKPAESSIYVIRCYNQMIKPNTYTGF